MILEQVQIRHFRVISECDITLSSGINFLRGPNGSGKTSVLEALYLTGRGRSFRHQEAGPFIQEGQKRTEVVSFFEDSLGKHVLGVARTKSEFIARLDRQPVQRRSDLVKAFPVQLVTSQPQDLLEGEPELRRRFLDFGLFHVEHFIGKFAMRCW